MDNITPGHNIQSFVIGQRAADHPMFKEFQKITDRKFKWQDIQLRVNDAGLIDLISTRDGSFGEIATGQTFRHVIENGHNLLYDEFDQVFYLVDPGGLCIEKEYENLPITELLNSKIQYLTVFDIGLNKQFNIDNDFEKITRDNLADFELKNHESEQFLKNAIRQFKSTHDKQTRPWWKIW
ncbi:MAG: hypothetical protein Q8L81_09110 [Bacteroidota bacterium]|nr:hypothetical protein [Bacteroidota bacterium]